jgi:hypothetical protein
VSHSLLVGLTKGCESVHVAICVQGRGSVYDDVSGVLEFLYTVLPYFNYSTVFRSVRI